MNSNITLENQVEVLWAYLSGKVFPGENIYMNTHFSCHANQWQYNYMLYRHPPNKEVHIDITIYKIRKDLKTKKSFKETEIIQKIIKSPEELEALCLHPINTGDHIWNERDFTIIIGAKTFIESGEALLKSMSGL